MYWMYMYLPVIRSVNKSRRPTNTSIFNDTSFPRLSPENLMVVCDPSGVRPIAFDETLGCLSSRFLPSLYHGPSLQYWYPG